MKFTKAWIDEMTTLAGKFPGGRVPISGFPHADKYNWKSASKQASVFIPLCNRNGVASILFTVRSQHVGTHKGQVSFPGGHLEPGETETAAAHRETFEELGFTIGELQTIGNFVTLPAKTKTPVHPVIGFIEQDVEDFKHFEPSLGEVERVFTRSIEQLLDPAYKRYEILQRDFDAPKVTMPVFGWSDENGDKNSIEYQERIWGLTALILESALDAIIMPTKPTTGSL